MKKQAPAKTRRKKSPERQRRAGKYDRIIKENIVKSVPGICEKALGITIVQMTPVSLELHYTRERKADFIGIASLADGRRVVLHLEFQARDDKKMVYREFDYKALLKRKYPGLEILQYVIFLGRKAPAMATELRDDDLFYRYHLVPIVGVDYRLFLKSKRPEEVIWAALANFGGKKPLEVMEEIVEKLKATASGLDFQRFTAQLRVLTNLRNLQQIFDKAMLVISEFFVEERDPLFKRGKKLGEKHAEDKKNRAFVISLLTETDLPVEKIARLAGVDMDFVHKIMEYLKRREATEKRKKAAATSNGNGSASS